MARRKPARPVVQPGAFDTSLQKDVFYRSPMYLEQQKFKDSEKTKRQLSLVEAGLDALDLQDAVESSGLDLTVSEMKALHALGQLLSATDHKGNRPGKAAELETYKWSGGLPVLSFTRSQFFEAYGISRKGDGSYYGHQADEALEALRSLLTDRRRLCVTRTTWSGSGKDRKARREAVVYTGSLATMAEPYSDLMEEELAALHGEDVPRRSTSIEVVFGPLFVDGLESFYVLKPATGYKELQAARRPKRIRQADLLFADWLQTWSRQEVSISKDKLLERLRLDGYVRRRKRRQAEAILQEVLDTAVAAGFLLKYEEKPGKWSEPVLHLKLNPEKIGRLRATADVETTLPLREASDG